MREFEIKFQVPEAARLALGNELRRRGARSIALAALYFDTADGLLAQHRVALRLRKEGRRWVQTLKAAGGSALDRLEHNVPIRVAAGTRPVPVLARHDGTEVGRRLREALGDRPEDALIERYATDVTRLAVRLQWPDSEVEAAFDIGQVRAGDRALPICELELEHCAGGLHELFELARLWRGAGQLWLDARPKSQRGSQLAEGLLHGAAVPSRLPLLDAAMDSEALVRAVVDTALEQVLANASELAAGSTDEGHVHQLRVGLRRLRIALQELGPLAQGIDAAWAPALAQTFGRLGRLRDDATVARAVHGLLEGAGAPKLAWPVETTAADAAAIVREATFQDTLIGLLRWTSSAPGAAAALSAAAARTQVARRLSTLHKQAARAGRDFEQLPSEEQHQVRKRLKRLRYLAEFVASLWPRKPARRYLKRLAPAQDALGRHNDIVVAQQKFQADAQHDPLSLFAAGFLRAHQAVTAGAAGAALRNVERTRRFWKR